MLFLVTLVVGILFYRVMIGFFVPLFLAALLVVIFRPVHEWIGKRLGGRPRVAALATTLAILLVVLLPAVLVIGIAAAQGTSLVSRVNYNSLAFALERTRARLGLEIDHPEPLERLPELIMTLSETENLDDPRQLRLATDRVRELRALLGTLEQDFAPLEAEKQAVAAQVDERLNELEDQILTAKLLASPAAEPLIDDTGEGATGEVTGIVADDVDDEATGQPAVGVDDEAVGEVADEAEVDEFDYRSPEERFQRTLVALDSDVHSLIEILLGGSIRSQLKILANPSNDKLDQWFAQAREFLQARLVSVTSATGEFLVQTLIGISILIITLYFFLVDGPSMVRTLMRLSPLDDRYELKLLLEFDRTSRAVVLATVLSALAQGILATFGYYFAGLGSIVLLFLLTSFMALIPFLGAASIWLPCCLWLGLVEERLGAAIGLGIFGAVVVSSFDNVIKVFILHGRSQLHPLLALLSVLGGVQVFGPIGILVGPMVVVFLQTTLEILNHELSNYESGGGELAGLAVESSSSEAKTAPSPATADAPANAAQEDPAKEKRQASFKARKKRRRSE
ncbi:AI-2E family transporter [Planctomycetaceae bacterium SH139]